MDAFMRDRSIDVGRGILVVMMIYGHVLQFFADTSLFPAANRYIDLINLTVFPTFVFFFGATAVLAYLDIPYLRALPGMVKTALRSLVVFYLSGIGYRVLREGKPFAVGTVRNILKLGDIPGWSEFLVSFALYSAMMIVFFALLRWLSHRPLAALALGAVCLAACIFVPYSRVQPVQMQLIIGGRDFACFPIVQYMPYFLAGMIYARADRKMRLCLLGLAAVSSLAGLADAVAGGGLSGRFPPEWSWIALPALLIAAVLLMAKGLCLLCGDGIRRAVGVLCEVLSHFGSRSLYYLLTSNLVLFTLSGKGIIPVMKRKSVLPWTAPIQAPQGAVVWTVVMIASLWFVALLAGRSAGRKTKQ